MSFQDTWTKATVDQQPDQPPEPGTYIVTVIDAKAITSKAGDDYVIVELKGLDGAAAQHQWSMLQGFKSEQQAGITKRIVRDLGVNIDEVNSLDELGEALKPIIGRYFTVSVKQNGDYRNTYIDGPAGDVQLPAAAAGGPGSATDEDGTAIPF